MSEPIEAIDRVDAMLGKLERIGKILLSCLGLILAGAGWAASMQWRVSRIEAEQHDMRPKVEGHDKAIANIEGRLHGIASQVGKVPGRVAAKLEHGEERP